MVRRGLGTLVAALLFATALPAQTANCQFRWQAGQVLLYRVEHLTSATEQVSSEKSDTKTRLNLTKRWQVLDVDAAGIATLQLSLLALRLETTTPSGGALIFDSSTPEKNDPHLSEELSRFVGQPLALLRVDSRGRVIEVKESKHGPASRFESELPFVIVLPDQGPRPGKAWQRSYKIKLEPPQGTGESYDATQTYACKSMTEGAMTIELTSDLKTMPENQLDRVPLLQLQPQGSLVFDVQNGRLQKASLHIEKELTGHQGAGSSYRFQSSYVEEYAGDK
jgi:hypothetical protein